MKSVMEEASSIVKAIEKGWMNAGQPKEFTVKIFEEPQKNFLGLTVRSAKVAILFSDEHVAKEPSKQKIAQKHIPQPQDGVKPAVQRQKREQRPRKIVKPEQKREPRKFEQQEVIPLAEGTQPTAVQQPVWTDSMIAHVKEWTQDTLGLLDRGGIQFTIEPSHFHLRINFAQPVFEDKGREKQLFSSLSTLLLQMLKYRYNRPLKGYKIILIGAS